MNEKLINEIVELAGDTDAVLYGSGMPGTPIYSVYTGDEGEVKLSGTQWQGQDMDNAVEWASNGLRGCYVIHPSDETIEEVDYCPNKKG